MTDANLRWPVDQSIAVARAFRDFGLTWLEEPAIPDDVAGHARIVREGGVPDRTTGSRVARSTVSQKPRPENISHFVRRFSQSSGPAGGEIGAARA